LTSTPHASRHDPGITTQRAGAPTDLHLPQEPGRAAPKPLRVTWVGLRGIPGVQGGVETHAEQLTPRLKALGCEVTVVGRRGYAPETVGPSWRGVALRTLWTPRHKHLEAVVHTGLAVLDAALRHRPDVLHIQAIGPALWAPVARLLGLKVVVTHHGADYERQKWGLLARTALRLGEALGARTAHGVIAISDGIAGALLHGHGCRARVIPNGVTLPGTQAPPAQPLTPFGLTPGRYVLLVSRLVPEKRHLDLMQAFERAGLARQGWRLAIVGGADHGDDYARTVVETAGRTAGVIATGFQQGQALQALVAHAGLFVLPSSHEGLPIALLEALSWGLPVRVSDIPAHQEVALPPEAYFRCGDVDHLAQRLSEAVAEPADDPPTRRARAAAVARRYDWDKAAAATLALYERVARPDAQQRPKVSSKRTMSSSPR
jgi:glycosyltransferase involved in cell wall biosynthesis